MNGCTINIADFRCRALRTTLSPDRFARRQQGFEVVQDEMDREAEMLQEAVLQDDPTVYDIGIAREAQRLRRRAVFRPINVQRKAKVLRFRDEVSVPCVMHLEERRAESWPGRPDGPHDHPPAA